ncbi:HAD family hydrolase, partial [Streptomyces sp. 2MCAF27]
MGSHLTHIVWDWNGTLLHDVDVMLAAVNASCAEVGLPPLTLERYRDLFCVPVPRFYARLLGRVPTDIECRTMDASFYRHYEALT